jgi:hypothetical protein
MGGMGTLLRLSFVVAFVAAIAMLGAVHCFLLLPVGEHAARAFALASFRYSRRRMSNSKRSYPLRYERVGATRTCGHSSERSGSGNTLSRYSSAVPR